MKYGKCKVEKVPYTDAVGRIAAAAIVAYPPGIPLIAAGEVISEEEVSHAWALRSKGKKVLGMDEKGYIQTIKD